MSVGFSSALDDLQRRLAGSETHAAMVVTLDFDGAPLMWFLDRTGKARPATAFTKPAGAAVTPSGGGITGNDLNDMIAYVAQFRSAMYTIRTLAGCHATALVRLDQRRAGRLTDALKRAAAEAETPHVCICKRRFRTARGLAAHISRARRGQHAEETK